LQPIQPPSHPAIRFIEDALDKVVRFSAHFGRYALDMVGVGLVASGLILLLGLLDVSQGSLVTPLAILFKQWFGIGSYFVVAGIFYAGWLALRWQNLNHNIGHLWRVLGFEAAGFSLLALLALFGNASVQQIEAGLALGGRIGWGLAELVSMVAGDILAALVFMGLFVLFSAVALGVPGWINAWVDRTLGLPPAPRPTPRPAQPETRVPQLDAAPLPQPAASAAPQAAPAPEVKASQPARKPLPLLPHLRKPLDAPEKTEKTGEPAPRSELLPPLNLLLNDQSTRPDERAINQTAATIEKTLGEFGVPARVAGYRIGPTVTQYAVEPGFVEKNSPEGIQQFKVRVAQIAGLSRDLALALSAERLRIEAPVPGQPYVGIEVPNARSSVVRLRSLIESDAFRRVNSPLAFVLGRNVSGQPVVADLSRMPHMLVAGTTGSGKSVYIEALTLCLVMNNTPADLRLAMIDPKMVELVRFNGLPHLLGKVETSHERCLGVLKWAVAEMEQRYRLLEEGHSKDISSYNRKMQRRGQPTLPRIVVMVDELADLMMAVPDETEHFLVRLAQMARATGIHLVVATQRPSTDVVTGLIKANFPARIAFTVASSVDSRVILDTPGAETLLGRGDMLFVNPEVGVPLRAQGVLVTDAEIEKVSEFWRKSLPAQEGAVPPWDALMNVEEDGSDELVEKAVTIVKQAQRASASMLQRRLRVGYPRAARLIDQLEELGVVGPSQGGGKDREVLLSRDDDSYEPDESEESPF